MNRELPSEVTEKMRLGAVVTGAQAHHKYVKRLHVSAASIALMWDKIAASAQDHNRELAERNRAAAASELQKVTVWANNARASAAKAQAAYDANHLDLEKWIKNNPPHGDALI